MSQPEDKVLNAAHVQKVVQGLLDAWQELSAESGPRPKRVANWALVNECLMAGDQLNRQLSDRLKSVGIEPAPSRSKP